MVSGPESIEIKVLSRMLWTAGMDAEVFASQLEPYHFPTRTFGRLFAYFTKLLPEGLDPVAIRERLKESDPDLLDAYMQIAATTDPVYTGATGLVKALKAANTTTRLTQAITDAQASLAAGMAYDSIRSALDSALSAIDSAAVDGRVFDDKGAMAARILSAFEDDGRGLTFGYPKMDERVTPILPGNLVIVAGRPGTGKSTDLRNWAMNWVQAGEHVAYFSLEMTGDEKLPHFACMLGEVPYEAVIRNRLTIDQAERFGKALQYWVDLDRLTLNDRASVTPQWLLKQILRYRAMGITTFIVDHLHRIRYTQNAKGDIRLAMAELVRDLKSLAVDTDSRIICGAQLTKGDKHEEPGDDMIREAGQLVDEADKIFLKWLPLVAGTRDATGQFIPTVTDAGGRIFAKGAPANSILGMDTTRTYLKIGKQRVRTSDGFIVLGFNALTGRITNTASTF